MSVIPAPAAATGATANQGPAIDLRRVSRQFPRGPRCEVFTALAPTTLTVAPGEAVAVVGPSGTGKTTLLHIAAGLLAPSAGEVYILGVAIHTLGEAARDRFRAQHLGVVFQVPNLLAAFSALANVMLAMDLADVVPPPERRARAVALLTSLGLGDRLHHRPEQLSVGEQQRVGVARALANQPRVVLADEPTASVDPATRQVVLDHLLHPVREAGCSLLLATHDPGLLPRFDRVEPLPQPPVAGPDPAGGA